MKMLLLQLVVTVALVSLISAKCVHGEYFVEVDKCVCNQCYSGPLCDKLIPNCIIQLHHQQCTLCKTYWQRLNTTVSQPIDFQMKYQEHPLQDGIGPLLKDVIVKVHAQASNCDVNSHHIVYGTGGTQLIHAFIYAFHKVANKSLNIYARTPYYQYYRTYSEMNPSWGVFNSSRSMNPKSVLEFVALPNNPDGSIHTRAHYHDSLYQVFDMVYYWKHNMRNITKVSYDNMLFSLSKMTGHSSTRFGWAFVKNREIAEHMIQYVWLTSHGVSIESQWKAYVVLKAILDHNGAFYGHMTQLMNDRWERLLNVINNDPKRTLTILSPKGFVVAWFKCNRLQGITCHHLFLRYNIRTNPGPTYGASEEFARFNMQGEESTFNILLDSLKRLLSV